MSNLFPNSPRRSFGVAPIEPNAWLRLIDCPPILNNSLSLISNVALFFNKLTKRALWPGVKDFRIVPSINPETEPPSASPIAAPALLNVSLFKSTFGTFLINNLLYFL